eukprot:703229-Lingulodinium_polyedra.AAC.1
MAEWKMCPTACEVARTSRHKRRPAARRTEDPRPAWLRRAPEGSSLEKRLLEAWRQERGEQWHR